RHLVSSRRARRLPLPRGQRAIRMTPSTWRRPDCILLASPLHLERDEGCMAVEVLVLKESAAGERRVAATPETVKKLLAAGAQVRVEPGAGLGAGITDQAYQDAGAQLAGADARAQAELVLCGQSPPVEPIAGFRQCATLVGQLQPQADEARA